MSTQIEMRWIVPDCTTSFLPILQFRTVFIDERIGGYGKVYGDWQTVQTQVVSKAEFSSANALRQTRSAS